VPIGKARLKTFRFLATRAGYSCALAALIFFFGSRVLQNAVAEGDTRTISMHHIHTDEDITITFKRDGRYDQAALEKLNWFLRDWRKGEKTDMDPHLIDLVWEVQREVGNNQPIWVVCGYRSPETNAMLRHRSRGVARFSQHMLGHAMDFYIPGAPLEALRVVGLRLARGGVGFYPTSGSPFVHMDTGSVRMWPRMTHEELARVFPDGKTVQIPTDGRPLSGYATALAEIRKRGNNPSENSIQTARNSGVDVGVVLASNDQPLNPFAKLLGMTKDQDEEADDSTASTPAVSAAAPMPIPTTRIEKPKPTFVAAVEAKVAAIAQQVKPIRSASAEPAPAAPAAAKAASPARATDSSDRFAALSPNQIIQTRGYWQGATGPATAAQISAQVALKNALRLHTEVASAEANANGSAALAYAAPAQDSPTETAALAAAATRSAAGTAGDLIAQNGMTVVAKGVIEQPRSSFQRAVQLASAAVKVSANRLDNPWLRAVILSPSVHRFLTTLALGARDFTSLATLMAKPQSALMMTFSTDPTMGLPHDHFGRGSAIVFLSTVNYPTHTAALQ
jgi:uncharacterized protein YcbK (DUF882 family)